MGRRERGSGGSGTLPSVIAAAVDVTIGIGTAWTAVGATSDARPTSVATSVLVIGCMRAPPELPSGRVVQQPGRLVCAARFTPGGGEFQTNQVVANSPVKRTVTRPGRT